MSKQKALRPTKARIRLDRAAENFRTIKERANGKKVIAVVKADAYGHGFWLTKTLIDEGADMLAVALIDEAIVLRKRGVDLPILILGHTPEDRMQDLIDYDIIPAVFSLEWAKTYDALLKEQVLERPIHLKIETGMGRIGLRAEEALATIEAISQLDSVKIAGIFSHFATADEADKSFTNEQIRRFRELLEALDQKQIDVGLRHIENSAALIDFDENIYDAVRPGIILYGLYPSEEVKKENLPIQPVMLLETKISHIKELYPGESVGYGRKFVAKEPRRIATLPVGYADGYSRILSGKGTRVYLNGQYAPVVGNICMDQCMVDITDIPDVQIGDTVELFGDHVSAQELADRLGTIHYELTCMINKRVPRLYENGKESFVYLPILSEVNEKS